ncbi:MAG: DUF1573 domain-containing protein [Patescibacteria group bacterium]
MKKFSYKEIIGIIVLVIIILFIINLDTKNDSVLGSKVASAKEIYSLFYCPCCGRDINTDCCEMSFERKNYVDSLIQNNSSENEVIMSYIKQYGIDSFIDENNKEEFQERLIKEAPKDRPKMTIEPLFYDLGDVSQKNGIVTTFFDIKNEGNKDLIINRLETSCGCTSASIIYKDQEGPIFSMSGHGINEEIKDWQILISPGEKVQLKVYYDPNVHPDFRGTAVREIHVFSNDPISFEKKAVIELNQVD